MSEKTGSVSGRLVALASVVSCAIGALGTYVALENLRTSKADTTSKSLESVADSLDAFGATAPQSLASVEQSLRSIANFMASQGKFEESDAVTLGEIVKFTTQIDESVATKAEGFPIPGASATLLTGGEISLTPGETKVVKFDNAERVSVTYLREMSSGSEFNVNGRKVSKKTGGRIYSSKEASCHIELVSVNNEGSNPSVSIRPFCE